jgi:pilus assembly protein CpaE
MAPRFLIYYRSPENRDYLQQALVSAQCQVLAAKPLEELPGQANSGADAVFLEYQEDSPGIDRWIEKALHASQAPAIFLYLQEVSTDSLWRALRLGVKECFAFPIKADELLQALRRLPQVQAAPAPEPDAPRLVSFMGCKGGVGSSFLAANVACLLAQEDGGQVLIVDLDLRYAQMVHFFDARPQYTLVDVVENLERLDNAYFQSLLLPYRDRLYLLPAPNRLEEADLVTPTHLERILGYLKELRTFPWIFLDCCHQLDEVTLKAVEMSDQLALVTTPVVPALANAKKLLEVFGLLRLESLKVDLWLNCWQKRGDLGPPEVEGFLGRPVAGTVLFEPIQVERSINAGKPLAVSSPGHPICRDLRLIVKKITGVNLPMAERSGRSWFQRLRRSA